MDVPVDDLLSAPAGEGPDSAERAGTSGPAGGLTECLFCRSRVVTGANVAGPFHRGARLRWGRAIRKALREGRGRWRLVKLWKSRLGDRTAAVAQAEGTMMPATPACTATKSLAFRG